MNKFRIILNGSVLSGFKPSQAENALIELFNVPEEQAKSLLTGTKTALNREYSAEDALNLQSKLNTAGVDAIAQKIEQVPEFVPIEDEHFIPPPSPSNSQVLMSCPACKHQQEQSDKCGNCGINFERYNAGLEHNDKHNNQLNSQWEQFEETDVSPEEQLDDLLLRFVGKRGLEYLKIFQKFKNGLQPKFKLSWNTSALLFPYWALYRRLWFTSFIGFLTWFLIPFLFIVFAKYAIISKIFLYLGLVIFSLNLIIFPLIANYIYYLSGRQSISFLISKAPIYTIENDVIAIGGTSAPAAFAGISFSLVFALFIWATVDSLVEKNKTFEVKSQYTNNPSLIAKPRLNAAEKSALNKRRTAKTRAQLRAARSAISAWLAKNKGAEITHISFSQIIKDLDLKINHFEDNWGNKMQLQTTDSGFKIISSGADKLFGSADDLSYHRKL